MNTTKTTDIRNQILCGDCLTILKTLPSNSINAIVTSPPYYNQRDYNINHDDKGIGNEESVDEYVQSLIAIFKECIRVIKNDGSIFFNIGDKYADASLLLVPYRFAIEATKIPSVYLINQITWVKPNPNNKRQ